MVNDNVFGTDIYREWQFVDGDLELATGKVNVEQAIHNRVNTADDTYTEFYREYGGKLYEHYPDFNHPTIDEYVRIEVESILEQDPRINGMECNVNKVNSNELEVDLKINPVGTDEVVPLNLIVNDDGGVFINSSEINDRRI